MVQDPLRHLQLDAGHPALPVVVSTFFLFGSLLAAVCGLIGRHLLHYSLILPNNRGQGAPHRAYRKGLVGLCCQLWGTTSTAAGNALCRAFFSIR
jgi:hypothetical protein